MTLRHALTYRSKGEFTLNTRLYKTGEFARKASVTLRTLRFYDRVGLLSPSRHTESGYRLYAEEDLVTLERILALKFLGLSLDEIKVCLQAGPDGLEETLAQQRAMMREKRSQVDSILKAIEKTEAMLKAGTCEWESIARVIQVIQMEQKTDWVKKYFTDDQVRTMHDLGAASYSAESLEKLARDGAGWTEEDQKRASEQWAFVASESKRLAESGADPGGEEAQAVAKLKTELLSAFTQGDPEIAAGLGRFWENFHSLPESDQPFDYAPFDAGEAGSALLDRAMAIYEQRHAAG